MNRKFPEISFRSEVLVDAVHEHVGGAVSDVSGGHAVAADDEAALGEEGNVRCYISELQVGHGEPERVGSNIEAATGTDEEGAPLPVIVLGAELHVG